MTVLEVKPGKYGVSFSYPDLLLGFCLLLIFNISSFRPFFYRSVPAFHPNQSALFRSIIHDFVEFLAVCRAFYYRDRRLRYI